jgi:hypothetical protein
VRAAYVLSAIMACCMLINPAEAQYEELPEDTADNLARQLANPIASLAQVPFQLNFDFGAGPDGDGVFYTLNLQPVIPINLTPNLNVISRTIFPILTGREDVFPGNDSVWGLGDTVQSFFFSPVQPGPGGLIWGAGPVFLIPTATDQFLGSEKWGAGPAGVALMQRGAWTFGMHANHIWSFAGSETRADVNATFLQPFVWYQFGRGETVFLTAEATYDWTGEQWLAPLNFGYIKVFAIGTQPVSFQLAGKYFIDSPAGGPDWGIRTAFTLLFPR